ncbi:MAG TPA: response regulator [Bryobacteraceae bacterium]|jgi:PAS domain S-box-containing protein
MKDTLLVLDDEALILASLEHLFEDDYEVLTATDAGAALRMALENDVAVILCDERMPGVAGHAFLRDMREISHAARVMMSGYADMVALTEAVNGGQIFAYIDKPWDPRKLKATVAAAVVHFKLVRDVDKERGLLRALMENIPDPIYFKDCQSRFTEVNQAHARNLGAESSEECIGKSDADYFDTDDARRWLIEEEEIVRSGQPQVDKIEHQENPRGGSSWWSITKVPMFDRRGKVSGIAGVSRNITALKRSEELLREQNEHNRLILETAHDAFLGMNPDGTITAWNPQAERTFGWTAAEALGQSLCDTVIAPAYREAHKFGLEHFLTTERGSFSNQVIEMVARHRNGNEFPVEATVWPVQIGGACSFNAFVRDISDRRRAEEARRKNAIRVQLLQFVTMAANRSSNIEHTTKTCLDRICLDIGWPLGHACLRANNSAEGPLSVKIWGLEDHGRFAAFREASDGEAGPVESGKPEWIVDLTDSQSFSRSQAAAQAGLRSGFRFPVLVEEKVMGVLEFFSIETAQPDEDLLTLMEHIGTQLGQVMIRQRAEEDLKRAKASAESANRAKSEFLTTMSHEMRTPMNAILGMADLLSESSLQAEQRDYVRIFQRAGANLLDLINDILDLSKVESGHLELETIGFELRPLLEKIIEMMAAKARDRGLKLTLEIAPAVPLGLIGDPKRLQQILVNLVGNALKFTERGSVTLRVEAEPDVAGWLRFKVIDTGIGIAAEKTEMIFQSFTQADSSTTRKYGGTGLGLAISRGLAELMGGRIGCSSEVGKGSTFFLAAPFDRREDAGSPEGGEVVSIAKPAAGVQRPQAVKRILIAEDSEFNLILVQAYLKDSGFELDVAENGRIAVDKTISGHPDLVLMDLQMPVMDGLEATRLIREWEAKTHSRPIPIFALTAHAAGEGIGKSLASGCNEHLTKPIKKAVLLEAIFRYVGGKIRITPPKDVEDLVPSYLANVRRDLDRILADVDSKNCESAGRVAHQLKGSGEGYGFPEITRTGAAVELAALEANEAEIRSHILALAAYLDRVEIVAENNHSLVFTKEY